MFHLVVIIIARSRSRSFPEDSETPLEAGWSVLFDVSSSPAWTSGISSYHERTYIEDTPSIADNVLSYHSTHKCALYVQFNYISLYKGSIVFRSKAIT